MRLKINKKLALLVLAIICSLNSIGQNIIDSNYYYYYKGEKIYLTLDKTKLNITVAESFNKSAILFSDFKDFELISDSSNGINSKFGKIEFEQVPNDSIYLKKINNLKQSNNIIAVSPYFITSDTSSIGTSSIFYVKLKNANDYPLLQAYADTFNVNIVTQLQFMPLWYRLSVTINTQGNSIETANSFYETGLFKEIDPAFIFNIKLACSNDTDFGSLWGLNNTQYPDIDINACDAWQITQGEGIKVAVFDNRVDINHNDLKNNILTDKYYDIATKAPTDPNATPIIENPDHGTHVAGIIAAIKNNNLQVAGVAPSSKLMRVNFLSLPYNCPILMELCSRGMSWAWQNGADVINNSWGIPRVNGRVYTHMLEDAINEALTNGRNGKGTVIVFAAGNDSQEVDYPAYSNPDIICVGSMNRYGEVSGFSNIGNDLDVVAPGEEILSTMLDNGIGYLRGTSMAAPYVSGIAALILSLNPNLTQKQVAILIEQTAKKIGNYDYNIEPSRQNGGWNTNAGYGLVDAYAAVQKVLCYENQIVFHGNITDNTTWDVNMYAYGNIVIETGATLTITSTIFCDPNTHILVKPGAKLIIDGGKLTSDCENKFWAGIHIEGNYNEPQTEQYQGYVELKNGAIIENSRNAISTWTPNDWNTTGGIIKATNSTFRNNIRSIEFLSYHNTNISSFSECTFIWDENMFEHNKTSLSHVTMYDVEGIKFVKCTFNNNNISSNIMNHGILSEESGLIVKGKLLLPSHTNPNLTIEKGEFRNFKYAIRVQNVNSKLVSITNTEFYTNACGIFTSNTNNFDITECYFNIDYKNNISTIIHTKSPPFRDICNTFGVCSKYSTGYKIKNNQFDGNFSNYDKRLTTIGIQIENSGSDPNEIKNNIFDNLYFGSRAIGKNKNFNTLTGLQYMCNNFSNCEYGIFVEEESGILINGIATNQGNENCPAGNVFNNNITNDIYNSLACSNIYHYVGANTPISSYPNVSNNIAIIHANTDNTNCITNGYILYKDELYMQHISLENEYLLLLYNYNNLLDGGQKDILLDKLKDSWQGDIWDLRNEYLNVSPYLSTDVLMELLKSEKIPLAVCTEILLSNPEATQKEDFKDYMYKGNHYLNPLAISLIEDSWNTKTFRASVEGNISAKLTEMELTSREIISIILNDTMSINIGEYRNILSNMRSINSKFELTDSYIDTKEYQTARDILFSLQKNENDEKEINDYLYYLELLESSNNNIAESILLDLSEHNTTIGHKAKSILYFNGISIDYHPLILSDEIIKKSIRIKGSLSDLASADITILPNPAKNYVSLTYNFPPNQTYRLRIYDTKGVELLVKILNGNKGMQTIDLKQFKSGSYFYTITDNKSIIKSDKLIITK